MEFLVEHWDGLVFITCCSIWLILWRKDSERQNDLQKRANAEIIEAVKELRSQATEEHKGLMEKIEKGNERLTRIEAKLDSHIDEQRVGHSRGVK